MYCGAGAFPQPRIYITKDILEVPQKLFTKKNMPASIRWGVENEEKAREQYVTEMKVEHAGFTCVPSGLIVNPQYPYLAASPDGLTTCQCHGRGTVEIKCPFKYANVHPMSVADKTFYLDSSDSYNLKKSHEYYSQIQGQMHIANAEFCDSVCWTPQGLHIQSVRRDSSFWDCSQPLLQDFFRKHVLPEMMLQLCTR